MNALMTIAAKEVTDHVRNGWVVAIAVAFAVFALAIAYAGFGVTGALGLRGEEVTLASLTSLAIYLMPLLGLLLGYDGIAGEHERGTMDLLLSYPLRPAQLLLGKWLGLSAVLAAAVGLGMVLPTALAWWQGHALAGWLAFTGLTVWLGAVFVGVALLLSTLGRDRSRLLGVALGVWLLAVVLFDVAMIGLLVATGGQVPSQVVSGLFFANPATLFRFLNLSLLLEAEAMGRTGLAAAVPAVTSLLAALLAWTLAPVALAAGRLRRQ